MKSNTSMLLLALGVASSLVVSSPAAEPLLSPKAAANQTHVVRTTNLNHLNAKTPAGSPRLQSQQARPSRTVVPRVQALPGTRPSPPSARSVKMPSSFSTSAASPAPLVLTNTTGQKVTLPTLSPGMTVSDPNSGVSVPVKSLIR